MIDQSALTTKVEATNTAVVRENVSERKKRANWITRLTSPLATLGEFAQLTKRTGRALWLIPMMGVLALLAVVLVFVQIVEYVAPFVYTIF